MTLSKADMAIAHEYAMALVEDSALRERIEKYSAEYTHTNVQFSRS